MVIVRGEKRNVSDFRPGEEREGGAETALKCVLLSFEECGFVRFFPTALINEIARTSGFLRLPRSRFRYHAITSTYLRSEFRY